MEQQGRGVKGALQVVTQILRTGKSCKTLKKVLLVYSNISTEFCPSMIDTTITLLWKVWRSGLFKVGFWRFYPCPLSTQIIFYWAILPKKLAMVMRS